VLGHRNRVSGIGAPRGRRVDRETDRADRFVGGERVEHRAEPLATEAKSPAVERIVGARGWRKGRSEAVDRRVGQRVQAKPYLRADVGDDRRLAT
jgi:hypothetical protein